MGFGVSQWSQSLIVFLSRRIPQCQLDGTAIDSTIGHIVLKYRWHLTNGEVRHVIAGEEFRVYEHNAVDDGLAMTRDTR